MIPNRPVVILYCHVDREIGLNVDWPNIDPFTVNEN